MVALWLIPGAIIADTALVLAVAWGLGEVIAWTTGDKLPIWLYVLTDLCSIVFICKWATGKDYLILAIYPSQWLAYIALKEPVPLWWCLYWLTMAQFVIAGPWLCFARNRTFEGRRGYGGL